METLSASQENPLAESCSVSCTQFLEGQMVKQLLFCELTLLMFFRTVKTFICSKFALQFVAIE